MTYHLTPVRMAIFNKSTNKRSWRGCEEKGTLLHCWWECKLVQPLWKTVWRFLKKLKIELPWDPAFPPLSLYLKNMKTLVQKDRRSPRFIMALFIMQLRYGNNKEDVVSIYNGRLLGHKIDEILPFATTGIDLEGIRLHEISQTEKDKYYMILLICGI